MTKTSVRVWALITGLSAMTIVVGLMGCAGDRYGQSAAPRTDDQHAEEPGYDQSTNQMVEDKRMAERVREALAAAPEYKFDGVKVMAGTGVVQLSGFVNTNAQRASAGEVTRKVAGVKSVENKLMVIR